MQTADPQSDASPRARLMLSWLMALFAATGLGFAILLLLQSLETGLALPGCGGSGDAGGCYSVLASRWARWLGIPVAVPAVATYGVALLGALVLAGPANRAVKQKVAGVALPVSLMALFAGLWFLYLQAAVVKAFCPYCLVVDVSGVGLGLSAIWATAGGKRAALVGPRASLIGVLLAALAATGLIGGQVLVDPPLLFGRYDAADDTLATYPVLGPTDAPHQVLLLADYTCPKCRAMHRALNQARQRYGDQLAVQIAPTTLDADCNPHVKKTDKAHETGCELAHLALAVWRVNKSKFAAMDRWLVAGDQTRPVKAARQKAVSLIGEAALDRTMQNDAAWRDKFLRTQARLSHNMGKSLDGLSAAQYNQLPKLLLSDQVLSGWPGRADRLFAWLEARSGLSPVASEQR